MNLEQTLRELNFEQNAAVNEMGHCLVIAGPGSGKTKMLAAKAAKLLDDPDNKVLAVTFSREAAIELLHRIKLLTLPSAHKRLYVGTFHGLSNKVLPNKLKIASDPECRMYVRDAIAQNELDLRIPDAMSIIGKIKSTGKLPNKTSEEGLLFYAYEKILALNRKMDFADILTNAVEGFENKTVPTFPANYFLVDEFQDTDPIQYRWMMAHKNAGSIITAVGDDDQSIYQFRSALGYEGMQNFLTDTNAKQIVLTANYRCKSEVLTAALNSIRHNKDRIFKDLKSIKGEGGFSKSQIFQDSESEAEFIVKSIGDVTKGSHAILSRNNDDLNIVESILKSENIPYFRSNNDSIFSHPDVVMFLGLVELVCKISKNVGIDTIFRKIDISEEDRDILHSLKINNFEKLSRQNLIAAGCSEDGASLYRNFATHFGEWQELNNRSLLNLMINGVAEWLIEKLPDKQKYARTLIHAAKIALERLTGDMASRIRYLKEPKSEIPEEHAIRLLTLHSSKGLEFDEVYILRAESSVCPSEKTPIDEERRLFYVGMTRAKERLFMTGTLKNKPSQFIAESLG